METENYHNNDTQGKISMLKLIKNPYSYINNLKTNSFHNNVNKDFINFVSIFS